MQQQQRSKRTKRDSAANLYRHCQIGGDCIPDVVNKAENKTTADKILQIGSSVIYLGGLGIGTGKGTGGATGYQPIGGRVPATGRPAVPRPAIAVDPLGPIDVGGLGPSVTAEAPSVVPLLEADVTVDPEVTISTDPGPNVIVHEVEVHPPPGNPTVATGSSEDGSVAILEVGSSSGASADRGGHAESVTSTSLHANPSFNTIIHSTPTPGEASAAESVVVSFPDIGHVVSHASFEEIPLQSFGPSEFEIDEGPLTSSPFERFAKRARQLYHRTVQQNPVTSSLFISRPSSLVQFTNPAFEPDPDITLTFDIDPETVRAAPDPDFRDVHTLGRVQYGRAPGGRVRVSRLGSKATMKLRSGTHTGGRTHFFYDISSIAAPEPESIELSITGEHSGQQVIVLDSTDHAIIDSSSFEGNLLFPDEELLDDYEEDFSHGQLAIATGRGRTRVVPASHRESPKAYVIIDAPGQAVVVAHPDSSDTQPSVIPSVPVLPVTPTVWGDIFSNFDLHPGLLKRKRKRHPWHF
ncbi:L2 [Canine papillomavirus 22]|uniref:L2 n=1 Tax=Canine papillomavirus 22 TaxID=2304620 RepID=UPI000E35B446|nr:L2 [Canine papillomavirus 22]AXQ03957.1 L2 [Canine papillomavirus 22]